MRPIEEDPGYQEMQTQYLELLKRRAQLQAELDACAMGSIPRGEALEHRLAEYERLQKQVDEVSRDHRDVVQALLTLKANWK